MATSESHEGRTPRGGVRSTMFFMDAHRNPCEKENAVQCEIVEYDAQGRHVGRTYGYLKGWTPGSEEGGG
jgi:hypothetical protein